MFRLMVTCPFCYNRINRLYLSFVCSGRPALGRTRCGKEVDSRRRDNAGSDLPMYPAFHVPFPWLPSPGSATCPRCGGRTGEHACPACHSPLPIDFGKRFSPVIAVVGAKGTGKTVYLAVAAHQVRTVLRSRFGADVSLIGDRANEAVNDIVRMIYKERSLPPLTQRPSDGRSEALVFEWRQERGHILRRYRSVYISFFDTAGEALAKEEWAGELDFLHTADAFIVILDPFTLPEARSRLGLPESAPSAEADGLQVLKNVNNIVRKSPGISLRGRRRKPMAVAFAKIDTFIHVLGSSHPIFRSESGEPWYDDQAGRAVHDSMRELLRDWGAKDIDDHMIANYTRYRYFALSSLGRPPDYEKGTVAAGGVRPLRVSDPLVWLLNRYSVIPRSNRG